MNSNKKKSNYFLFWKRGSSYVKLPSCPRQLTTEITSVVNCQCPHNLVVNCRGSHVSVLRKLTSKTTKTTTNKPIKMLDTCFLRQKCVDTSHAWCFNDFWARFGETYIGFGGLDGRGKKVDDEIVCRGRRWMFTLMKRRLGT
jgi:hypothetical protein